MATSENGWPLISEGQTQALPGLPNNARVLAGPVATVLGYVGAQFNSRVERVTSTSTFRANAIISGTSLYSNHASGTAIDLNGGAHPMGASGTFSAAQVGVIRQILAEVGGNVIRWGGDYSGRKDEMHFEIRPGITAAQVADAAARVTPQPPQPPEPPLPPEIEDEEMGFYVYNTADTTLPYLFVNQARGKVRKIMAAEWRELKGIQSGARPPLPDEAIPLHGVGAGVYTRLLALGTY